MAAGTIADNKALAREAAVDVNKITSQAGRVTDPGRYMFRFGCLTITACSSKAKMSALSKVEMSVSPPFWEFGGCHFDGHGGDEQARAEPS